MSSHPPAPPRRIDSKGLRIPSETARPQIPYLPNVVNNFLSPMPIGPYGHPQTSLVHT